MTNETKWGDWFAGTGKRPEGVADDEPVHYRNTAKPRIWEKQARYLWWLSSCEYSLRADHPFYGPPLWALDEAARRCDWPSWDTPRLSREEIVQAAIRELAKEIQRNTPPPDPDARLREECARLFRALRLPGFIRLLEPGKSDEGDAMIAELKTILQERADDQS